MDKENDKNGNIEDTIRKNAKDAFPELEEGPTVIEELLLQVLR